MRKKCWFYICIVQAVVILSMVFMPKLASLTTPELEEADLVEFLSHYHEDNNFLPDVGYVPDAETAAIVGSAIVDKLTGQKIFGTIGVTYDEENRLWKIQKGYLLHRGGWVVIEQDTGKVIKALLNK